VFWPKSGKKSVKKFFEWEKAGVGEKYKIQLYFGLLI